MITILEYLTVIPVHANQFDGKPKLVKPLLLSLKIGLLQWGQLSLLWENWPLRFVGEGSESCLHPCLRNVCQNIWKQLLIESPECSSIFAENGGLFLSLPQIYCQSFQKEIAMEALWNHFMPSLKINTLIVFTHLPSAGPESPEGHSAGGEFWLFPAYKWNNISELRKGGGYTIFWCLFLPMHGSVAMANFLATLVGEIPSIFPRWALSGRRARDEWGLPNHTNPYI